MSVDTDKLVSFFILWGTPATFSVVEYFKLSKAEKKEAIRDLTSVKSIVTTGFILTGGVMASLGRVLSLLPLQVIGTSILAIGGIVSAIEAWKTERKKSIVILVFIVSMIALTFVI
ncbi:MULTISPECIES: hypothetical protein [Priestia]|uniref:hypothetical protein n=1 Tax=Priestia TaxID=2800373 RepID=UPI001ADAF144|nr:MULTISPECIES: hypothetical protein [Priestia]MDR7246048.1 hypothetical protein [Priestia megaterium]QTL50032.1 hypothetical protein J5Z55_02655 [Priestia aryabhattai]USL42976.1 hypothetical protein LIS78_02575 [Priestia megaterium]